METEVFFQLRKKKKRNKGNAESWRAAQSMWNLQQPLGIITEMEGLSNSLVETQCRICFKENPAGVYFPIK